MDREPLLWEELLSTSVSEPETLYTADVTKVVPTVVLGKRAGVPNPKTRERFGPED